MVTLTCYEDRMALAACNLVDGNVVAAESGDRMHLLSLRKSLSKT